MEKCVICKREIVGYGNNAEPVRKGRCCDHCNSTVILPMRFEIMRINQRK